MTNESGNTLRIVEIMGMEKIATPARKLVFCSDKLTMFLIKILLWIHSFSYRTVGFLVATPAEKNLHPKHRIMNYHAFFVDNVNKSDTVLDIGCGNGALTCDVAKKAKRVVGIDLNENSISLARQRYSKENIEYVCGNVLNDLPDERFDVIILSNVLEHIDERVEFLKQLREMAPKLLIRVPMINRD
jgi:SAM-dependent methyltransferase